MLLSRRVIAVTAQADARFASTASSRSTGSMRCNALCLLGRPYNNHGIAMSPPPVVQWQQQQRYVGSISSPWISGKLNNDDYVLNNNDVNRNQRLYYHVLPKIRVTTFSSSSNQAHKSTVAGGDTHHSMASAASSSDDSSSTEHNNDDKGTTTTKTTFRGRMQERGRRGGKVARRGARSAKELLQQYGPVFVGTYATVYVGTVATLFAGVESGVLDPSVILSFFMDNAADQQADDASSTVSMVVELLENYSWTRPYAPMVEENPTVAHLAIAWFATKFTEPIRLAVTATVTPRLARRFGYVHHHDDDEELDDHHHHHHDDVVSEVDTKQQEQEQSTEKDQESDKQSQHTK